MILIADELLVRNLPVNIWLSSRQQRLWYLRVILSAALIPPGCAMHNLVERPAPDLVKLWGAWRSAHKLATGTAR